MPCGSESSPNTFSPESRPVRLTCAWQPEPAESANGFDMKVAFSPWLWAICLTAFLNEKALSGPASPAPGRKLISHWEPAYSQLAVMISIPNAFMWSTSSVIIGT